MTIKKCKLVIYKVTCLVNQKVYVGMTKRGSHARWLNHVADAKHGSDLLFHRAIRKYGPTSFSVEDLQTADSHELACDLECFWIQKLNSKDRLCGYNMAEGGLGGDFYIRSLSPEQLLLHKLKISQSKSGCKPVITDEVRQARSAFMKQLNEDGRACTRTNFKKLILVSPYGQIYRTEHITRFCSEHDLSYGKILRYARGQQRKLPDGWWVVWNVDQSDMEIEQEWRNHVKEM